MHPKVLRGLRIRHAPLFDQPHSLKLELACKLPSLHDTPPVPSKHLTRCLRNQVQARLTAHQPRTFLAISAWKTRRTSFPKTENRVAMPHDPCTDVRQLIRPPSRTDI